MSAAGRDLARVEAAPIFRQPMTIGVVGMLVAMRLRLIRVGLVHVHSVSGGGCFDGHGVPDPSDEDAEKMRAFRSSAW